MVSKKISAKKIRDVSTGTFFRITSRKIVVDAVISVVLVLLFFYLLPFASYVYSQESFGKKIVDIIVNTIVYMLIFYPLSCYITLLLFKKER